jgi:serine/threonine-protein kinase
VCPLRRDGQIATLMAHATESVPTLPRTMPAPVRDLVRSLTARDPRRRPPGAAPVAGLARAAIGAATVAEVAWWSRRRRVEALAVAPVAAIAIALALFVVIDPDGGPVPQAAVQAAAADPTSVPTPVPSGGAASVLAADRSIASASRTPASVPVVRRRRAAPRPATPVHGHGAKKHGREHGRGAKKHGPGHHGPH